MPDTNATVDQKWFGAWRRLSSRLEEGIQNARPGSERQESFRSILFEMNRIEMEIVTGYDARERRT